MRVSGVPPRRVRAKREGAAERHGEGEKHANMGDVECLSAIAVKLKLKPSVGEDNLECGKRAGNRAKGTCYNINGYAAHNLDLLRGVEHRNSKRGRRYILI